MSTYTAIRIIGRGCFGGVQEVEDSEGNRFARKTFAPSAAIADEFHDNLRKRFRREVWIQQEWRGNAMLPVLDHELDGPAPWFIMPLAEKTYQAKIAEDRAGGSIEIGPIADILNGLQSLHEIGYGHRDLNPNNILFHDGTWRLSDLGALLPPSGNTMTLTEDTIIYTEAYRAPEQRLDIHSAQPPADVYSFGCILHDLVGTTHRTPYTQHSAAGQIGLIIEKCTDETPKRRPNVALLRALVIDALIEVELSRELAKRLAIEIKT
jgi:serine/threonine protein kinase